MFGGVLRWNHFRPDLRSAVKFEEDNEDCNVTDADVDKGEDDEADVGEVWAGAVCVAADASGEDDDRGSDVGGVAACGAAAAAASACASCASSGGTLWSGADELLFHVGKIGQLMLGPVERENSFMVKRNGFYFE